MEILHNFGGIGKQILDLKYIAEYTYEAPNEAANFIQTKAY